MVYLEINRVQNNIKKQNNIDATTNEGYFLFLKINF
jgi:hypothetical protein